MYNTIPQYWNGCDIVSLEFRWLVMVYTIWSCLVSPFYFYLVVSSTSAQLGSPDATDIVDT